MKRQGDILLIKTTEAVKGQSVPSGIVLRGEATGHAHRLTRGTVIKTKDGKLYLKTIKGSELVHEEHKSIKLEPGLWAVIRQREYTSADCVRLVVD